MNEVVLKVLNLKLQGLRVVVELLDQALNPAGNGPENHEAQAIKSINIE